MDLVPRSQSSSRSRLRPRSVLVVADGPEMIGERLRTERPQLELTFAATGAEAINLVEERSIDLVIVDDSVQDTDVLELIEALNALPHPPTSMIIASKPDADVAVRAMKLGAQDYVVKGPQLTKLPLAVDRAFRIGQLHHRLRTLSEMARSLVSTFDIDEVFRILAARLPRIVPYKRLSLKVLRPQGGFDVRSVRPPEPGQPVTIRSIEPNDAAEYEAANAVIEAQKPRIVHASQGDPMHEAGATRYAMVPIVADGVALGALAVGTDDSIGFREQDIELLVDVAAHMAIALSNARVYADLETAYTDLKDAKEQLVRSEKLESLGEMAAGVAHDFNNLLSAILGRAQMLKVMLEDPEKVRSLEVIEKAALDGARTVARIQEFAKAKSEGDFVPIDLGGLLDDTVERAMSSVRARPHPIQVVVDKAGDVRVRGNPSELRQVLTNLIYNAVDAMPSGGDLRVSTDVDGQGQAWFEVADTGAGMDGATVDRMFNPFFTTKGTRGTGLGLSVSYSIIQRHGGEFTVESAPGAGTRIRVTLPAYATADIEPMTVPRPEAAESGAHARILVIDDDHAVLDVLADILRSGDHDVVAAQNGKEGLALFSNSEFDLVFTDLGMPEMNGWEVAKGIKAQRPETPVGLITGWGTSIDEKQMRDAGIDLLVPKPFRYDDVLSLVDAALGTAGSSASRVATPAE